MLQNSMLREPIEIKVVHEDIYKESNLLKHENSIHQIFHRQNQTHKRQRQKAKHYLLINIKNRY